MVTIVDCNIAKTTGTVKLKLAYVNAKIDTPLTSYLFMKLLTIRNIIFDFDGTLFDTANGIIFSVNHTFKKLELKKVSSRKIIESTGPPLQAFIERVLNTKDPRLALRAIKIYKQEYGKVVLNKSIPFPGIADLIKSLFESGFNLYIVTNKQNSMTIKLLKKFRLIKYFKRVIGQTSRKNNLSKKDMIKLLIRKESLQRPTTCIVGDKNVDIKAGRSNNIFTIGVTFGYGAKGEIIESNPDFICHSVKALKMLLYRDIPYEKSK